MIALLACGPAALDPASREPQPVRAPFGDARAVLADGDGHVLVTTTGALRIGPDGALREVPAPALPTPPAVDGDRFLRGSAGPLWVGGADGPHGRRDGWLVTEGREAFVGGPGWEVLHAVAPMGDGWLAAGVGEDGRVGGAVWVVRLGPDLAPAWERRFDGGQDHVAAVVPLGERAVVLALGGGWNDAVKPLTAFVVRADGTHDRLPVELGRVRSAAAAPAGTDRILLATTDLAGRQFVRWLDVP